MKYYAQFGEDQFLNEQCELPEIGVFVDVGAGGTENSNSLFFEEKGWTVLCIEPDTRHPGLDKRKLVDTSVVGDSERMVKFTKHRFPQLSGLNHNDGLENFVLMKRLDTVLDKYGIEKIDVLSVDVEGSEIMVLQGLDIDKYQPKYIVIEHSNQFKGNCELDTELIMKSVGYDVVFRSQSNLIVKRK